MRSFSELIEIDSIHELDENEQIDIVGNLFDLSFDNKSILGIEHAFHLSKQIKLEALSETNFTIINYDLSNGWSYLRKLKYKGQSETWNFQLEELTKEIFFLRKAISSLGFQKTIKERQCQIYTNLGNTFSFVGRFVEAQEYYRKALNIIPEFSMASGNSGNGLFFYGRNLYDFEHQMLLITFGYHYLKDALSLRQYLEGGAETGIRELHDFIKPNILEKFQEERPDLNYFDLGNDNKLAHYRKWCLENTLFINPLNDLGNYTVASHDCLNLPTLLFSLKEPPTYLNLFNQIKQEFGTARYSYYASLQNDTPHFSDLDIALVESMETVMYSYYIEQLKISFRLSYSILDKIAYLLNDYLKLGIGVNQISFRTLWHKDSKKKEMREFFLNSDNWALRGLFWLSKDLFNKEDDFDTVLEPDSNEVAKIRNFIEHKGFKVIANTKFYQSVLNYESDISYVITRDDFELKTLRLLKLTRAAIMYLAIAISHEEKGKDYSNIKAIPMSPRLIPDYMRR